ncbi:EAL domain-containing protein [Dokdonella sp.]|uniref:GGDEF/EAL domain-containing response regulator n=1 Tax=Dokdonella sp. TaxID=2291710 RepID=UPI0025C24CFB|nr:EAL domain-containing protein [Dokdonella sp.]
MSIETGNGAVLIVATDRDDRRILFDALDAQEFDAIYTAKDIGQARALLEQEPHIDLVLLEFVGEAADSVAFCSELRRYRAPEEVPVIGIRRPGSEGLVIEPAGVVAWLASPVDPTEALARVTSLLGRRVGHDAAMSDSGERYRFAFDGSLDELALVDPKSGRVLDVNTAFVQRSGFARAQLIGGRIDGFDALLSPDQRSELGLRLAREGSIQFRAAKPRTDGSTYPVDVCVQLSSQEGRLVHFYAFRELGELGRYQQALALIAGLGQAGGGDESLNAAMRSLIDWLSLDFVALVSARPDQSGETQPLVVYHRFSPDDETPDPLRQPTLRHVLDGDEVIFAADAWRLCADDGFVRERRFECVFGVPLCDERRVVLGALVVARREPLTQTTPALDTLRVVGQRMALELELRRTRELGRVRGLQDSLTGLPNRLLFNDRLESVIQEAHRTGEMFAVLFVDLDRFKNINDSLGHNVGDHVLVAVARRLRASVRASDTVARYAGDEFTMILRHIVQREDVMRIADKIVRVMEAPLTLPGGLELQITASLGLSFYPDDATTSERLLKQADVAMYTAKGMGRNNYQAYVAVPEDSHQQRLALEAKLRQAERNGELRVFYQPQVDTRSEDIVGMEALIRWEHPELGMISPGFFIPLAEETGLIIPIGEWVLRAACADARRWQTRFSLPLRISVNLSPLQLRQPNLVALVASVLEETGVPPHLLDLEVTESISVKSIPNLLETLQALRELGCQISIDDFGTGQSSLDYIKRFPADRIKIDQAFVRNIGVDPDDEAIVQATIGMAHNLNRSVVAEGVEIEAHLDFLRGLGCEVLQGYLFCRPLPAASLENLLVERERLMRNLAVPDGTT